MLALGLLHATAATAAEADLMYETRRAIEAGRAVVEEMAQARRRDERDKFVE